MFKLVISVMVYLLNRRQYVKRKWSYTYQQTAIACARLVNEKLWRESRRHETDGIYTIGVYNWTQNPPKQISWSTANFEFWILEKWNKTSAEIWRQQFTSSSTELVSKNIGKGCLCHKSNTWVSQVTRTWLVPSSLREFCCMALPNSVNKRVCIEIKRKYIKSRWSSDCSNAKVPLYLSTTL